MNKIAKKIVAFTSLLTMTASAVACGGIGGGGEAGELTPGFWAELAAAAGGNSTGGNLGSGSGDFVVNGNATAVEAYKGGEVTITFYHTMGAKLKKVLDDWIPVFNQQYPNITVVHQSYGDYPGLRDQILTELTASEAPSIAYCYPDHVALYKNSRAVVSLDDYIVNETMGLSQSELNDFVRGYLEEGRAYGDGKMYTLPYSKSTEVLYYNKTFFEKHNLKVPTTWDEMEEVALKIREIDPNSIPLGYDSESNWFITMCEQLGTPYTSNEAGQKFLYDTEINRSFVERLRTWFKKFLVTTEELSGSYTSDLFTETDPNETKAYMCIGSSAGATYQCPDTYTEEDEYGNIIDKYPFEVGVTIPPQIDPKNPKVISQGPSLCMFKQLKSDKQTLDTQKMAAAWLFMKFLTMNVGLQANFSSVSGYAPVIANLESKNSSYADELAKALENGNASLPMICVKQCLAQEKALFVSPAFVGSSGARDQVGLLIQRCFAGAPASGQSVSAFIAAEFGSSVSKLRYEYGA